LFATIETKPSSNTDDGVENVVSKMLIASR